MKSLLSPLKTCRFSCARALSASFRKVNGSEGRYRITTSWQTASDLRRHPDWYAVCVEATVLLFGSYHLNLVVAFVALVAARQGRFGPRNMASAASFCKRRASTCGSWPSWHCALARHLKRERCLEAIGDRRGRV